MGKLIKKILWESDDLDWVRDVPSNQKVRPWNGNIGYPTADKTSPTYGKVYLYTDDEGVTREIKVGGLTSKHRTKNYKGEWFGSDGEVSFYDASIMSSDIESKNYDPEYPDPFEGKYRITMSRQEYNDNARKGKLALTPNNNSTSSINESEIDFDWTDDFQWTIDMLYSMLENCNEIKISNYSLKMDSAYKSMGGPVIYTLTRCKEWWDRFSTIELDDNGRGPAEWYDDYDEGRIGLISAYGTKNKNIRDIDWEDIYNHEGWTISQEPYQIVDSLNGKGSELFILLDDNGRPIYDLIPKEHRERIKTNWEDRFYGKNINESDEDPLKWIKDVKTTNTLTEAAGISFEARKWGETIYNEIMNNPDEKKRLIIDGYDHPETFNGFPIDYVVIDFYDRLTGYGQEHSGYDKDGNYVVLLYIQPKLLQGQGGYNLKSVLNHEMKHAWEDYNRLSKGLPSIEHTKESQELYNRDFILMLSDQNITGPIKEILKYYYYLSNLEKSAYLENVYDQNPTYERVVRDIARKDF